MRAHQFVSSLSRRDAIGNHSLLLGEALSALGVECEFYVDAPHLDRVGIAHLYTEFPNRFSAGDLVICQIGSYSALVNFLVARRDQVIVNYHNITPASFFEPWDPGFARTQVEARYQLQMLAELSPLAIADSEFNARELQELNYPHVEVLPVLFQTPSSAHSSESGKQHRAEAADREMHHWLFVGRLLPHKAPHDLIAALDAYVRVYGDGVMLHLVGADYSDLYTSILREMVARSGLEDRVIFHGSVSDEELDRLYFMSDLYVSASLHEGFCVPLLEAFSHELPVVAVSCAAVPETLGDGGILVPPGDPLAFAAAAHLLISDPDLREQVVAAGRQRLNRSNPQQAQERLREILEGFLP
ncbi:MAG: glycosyltransferase family 4 protein [Acidimicrobiales bacterium]